MPNRVALTPPIKEKTSQKQEQPTNEDYPMKITKGNYAFLKTSIDKVLAKYPNVIEEYETGRFARSDRTKDLQRRFCWDLLYAAGIGGWVSTLYNVNGMNDDHIYTALKAICPTLTKRY